MRTDDPKLPHLLGIAQALGELREPLVFEVEDTGIGLSAEQIEGLFRPFVQADAGTPCAFGGSGLGLALARRLCRLMGGELDVRSVIGVGSCFRITLPDAPTDAARKAG
jgi:signal transduction histidine kinase